MTVDLSTLSSFLDAIGALGEVISLLVGGISALAAIAVRNPVGEYLKKRLISDQDVLKRFGALKSFHAIATVLTIREHQRLAGATLLGVSDRAMHFFGKETHSDDLTDADTIFLMAELSKYMDEGDYKKFEKDQARLFKDFNADQPARAQVPVIFNETHPYYKNRAFLPVIVSLEKGEKSKKHRSERNILLAYLDVDEFLPAAKQIKERREQRNTVSI